MKNGYESYSDKNNYMVKKMITPKGQRIADTKEVLHSC